MAGFSPDSLVYTVTPLLQAKPEGDRDPQHGRPGTACGHSYRPACPLRDSVYQHLLTRADQSPGLGTAGPRPRGIQLSPPSPLWWFPRGHGSQQPSRPLSAWLLQPTPTEAGRLPQEVGGPHIRGQKFRLRRSTGWVISCVVTSPSAPAGQTSRSCPPASGVEALGTQVDRCWQLRRSQQGPRCPSGHPRSQWPVITASSKAWLASCGWSGRKAWLRRPPRGQWVQGLGEGRGTGLDSEWGPRSPSTHGSVGLSPGTSHHCWLWPGPLCQSLHGSGCK